MGRLVRLVRGCGATAEVCFAGDFSSVSQLEKLDGYRELRVSRQFLYKFRHFWYPVAGAHRLDFPVMCPLNHNQKSHFLLERRDGWQGSLRSVCKEQIGRAS